MDKQTLLALADRVEAATGPDNDLDCRVAAATGYTLPEVERYLLPGQFLVAPNYTASLDAALTLVPDGWNRRLAEDDDHTWYAELRLGFCTSYSASVGCIRASSPAIAMTAAALRARAKAL